MTEKKIEFSKEQMDYLKELFVIPCCHVTGEHNPTHCHEHHTVCSFQLREAYISIAKALGITPRVKSKEGCFWCEGSEKEHYKGMGKVDYEVKLKE